MPYDPNFPVANTLATAEQMQAQLNALHEETVATNVRIDNIPEGPPGPPGQDGSNGQDGPPFADAVVDGVTTLDLTISDPPPLGELQSVVDKMNELILALRRS